MLDTFDDAFIGEVLLSNAATGPRPWTVRGRRRRPRRALTHPPHAAEVTSPDRRDDGPFRKATALLRLCLQGIAECFGKG
ncbi:hypothetical protein [Micromonospora sp. NPDC050200]|uniref:hypothetical protein n=1 Tax=Micromonospora sp. NPDC050200 TaxID=3155664 RepID=UPI0033ECB91E